MIKDKLTYTACYEKLSENLQKGFEWLKNTDLENLEDGKYSRDGNNVFASVQTYMTKDDALYEAHRKYIDIQYVINGVEQIGVVDYSVCKTVLEYDSEKDIEFLECEKKGYQVLRKGEFIVLYPHDAHKPSIKYGKNSKVKKVVVKVMV